MPTELETALRFFAGELANVVEQHGISILPDVLSELEEQTRTRFCDAYKHCSSELALEPIRMPESMAWWLKGSAEMYALVGKHELAATVHEHAARYRQRARAALREWRPAFPYEKQPVLDL
jgi:hypothetical protein